MSASLSRRARLPPRNRIRSTLPPPATRAVAIPQEGGFIPVASDRQPGPTLFRGQRRTDRSRDAPGFAPPVPLGAQSSGVLGGLRPLPRPYCAISAPSRWTPERARPPDLPGTPPHPPGHSACGSYAPFSIADHVGEHASARSQGAIGTPRTPHSPIFSSIRTS